MFFTFCFWTFQSMNSDFGWSFRHIGSCSGAKVKPNYGLSTGKVFQAQQDPSGWDFWSWMIRFSTHPDVLFAPQTVCRLPFGNTQVPSERRCVCVCVGSYVLVSTWTFMIVLDLTTTKKASNFFHQNIWSILFGGHPSICDFSLACSKPFSCV